ncbi:DUF2306 domain-containing protein [Colwellia sp. 1_MG-2023]|uniref:DUF2306 domain-containing protein n=1 Tax=unclassified Colwellia TaxID=196834 RepID=UPI001C0A2BA8|nr:MULTISPECIES: DUF2306 domain-containing protein [unclassified Colwellia]MBU2925845.1 DUF2306 domain-containing protein [Colwellia sp. C2M11]MDO6489126.1 DUF2306 domain-containing protein [Colwellia sp. 6_MG-2023]MDO6652758.1 DUF2306 domain-containing protein [Colwellia sp. 3_MG-2023]MDO6665632.1 DUF2306 domain-containing protein [Colwellia sp. 2_MG-2023]MDO6690005.1 DUF2306 domain-containing protein [Colwellia sp. 1_MG-2023]
MGYIHLTYLHLLTVVPAFIIGTYLLLKRKGTPKHKALGKIYMVLMLITAIISLFMPAQLGSTFLNHFGYIHLLSLLTLYAVPAAYFYIKKGNIRGHKRSMIILYCGGILVAGTFALMPGRLLNTWLFT